MIEVRTAVGGARYVVQSAPGPLIYLDHGPMGQIAEHAPYRDRLVARLERGGTLALSLLNLLEMSKQCEGESVNRLEQLLGGADQRFVFLSLHANGVIGRAVARGCSELEASLDDHLAGLFTAFVAPHGGTASAARVSAWLRPSVVALPSFERMRSGVRATMTKNKSWYRNAADGIPAARTNLAVDGCLTALMHLALTDPADFTLNDSTDLIHLAVPLATCDFVVADKKWVPRARRVPVPPRRATVFSGKKGQLDLFLNALDEFPQPSP